MGESMLVMPTRKGYHISWPNGKVSKRGIVFKDCYEHTSLEKVQQKKEELEKQGKEVSEIYECIF